MTEKRKGEGKTKDKGKKRRKRERSKYPHVYDRSIYENSFSKYPFFFLSRSLFLVALSLPFFPFFVSPFLVAFPSLSLSVRKLVEEVREERESIVLELDADRSLLRCSLFERCPNPLPPLPRGILLLILTSFVRFFPSEVSSSPRPRPSLCSVSPNCSR